MAQFSFVQHTVTQSTSLGFDLILVTAAFDPHEGHGNKMGVLLLISFLLLCALY
jgi:hypothetical protein